jgi:hypothetical protein
MGYIGYLALIFFSCLKEPFLLADDFRIYLRQEVDFIHAWPILLVWLNALSKYFFRTGGST